MVIEGVLANKIKISQSKDSNSKHEHKLTNENHFHLNFPPKKKLAFKASVLLFCISNNVLTLLKKFSLSVPSKYMKYMKNSVRNLHNDYHAPLHWRCAMTGVGYLGCCVTTKYHWRIKQRNPKKVFFKNNSS